MSVNPQITDSITQVNTNVLGDAPAMAMGNLFQATAQALSNAAHNATSSQQQSYITMQASTVQGVMTLYGIDTASDGMATGKIFDESAAAVQTAATPTELTASPDVQRLIDELSHETADIGYHVRSLMSAFAASLDALSIVNSRQSLRILQNAAIAVCMKAMIEQPDKARELEETLEIIKKVVSGSVRRQALRTMTSVSSSFCGASPTKESTASAIWSRMREALWSMCCSCRASSRSLPNSSSRMSSASVMPSL